MLAILIEKFGATINIITNLFFLFTTLKTDICILFNDYYNKHFYFRFTFDILCHSYKVINGYLYDYPVEPFEKSWINKIITFDSENSNNCELVNCSSIPGKDIGIVYELQKFFINSTDCGSSGLIITLIKLNT